MAADRKTNFVPLYVTIYNQLKEEIMNNVLKAGSVMSSEAELMSRFHVSRHTVRHAIGLLQREELILKKQGRATFVNPAVTQRFDSVLHIGTLNPCGILLTDYTYYFADKVFELSKGQLQVAVHHSSEYGDGIAHVKKVKQGKLDCYCGAIDYLAELDEIWSLVTFPFLFDNIRHLKKFVASSHNDRIKNELCAKHNVKVLADNWYRPSRVLLSKKPVHSVHEIEQLKLGIPAVKLYKKIWELLGVSYEVVDPILHKDMVLKSDVFDAVDTTWDYVVGNELYLFGKFLILTNHLFSRATVIMNNERFKSLRPDLQSVLIRAAELAGEAYSEQLLALYENHKKFLLMKGMVFIEFGSKQWQRAVYKNLLKQYKQDTSEIVLYKQIRLLNRQTKNFPSLDSIR